LFPQLAIYCLKISST